MTAERAPRERGRDNFDAIDEGLSYRIGRSAFLQTKVYCSSAQALCNPSLEVCSGRTHSFATRATLAPLLLLQFLDCNFQLALALIPYITSHAVNRMEVR